MSNDFNLCPLCGSRNVENHHNRKWFCPDCGFDLYNNVAAAVGVIIYDDDFNVLFEVRAKEPRKGFITIPGGFVDPDECAENAAVRECREEIGVDVSGDDVRFLCTNPNTYPYKNIEYKTCDIFFTARLPPQFASIRQFILSLRAQESEVAGFESHPVRTESDVDALPLAFDSVRATLCQFVRMREAREKGDDNDRA